jgi:hypothetical protein
MVVMIICIFIFCKMDYFSIGKQYSGVGGSPENKKEHELEPLIHLNTSVQKNSMVCKEEDFSSWDIV